MPTVRIEIGVNHPNHLILRNLDKHVIIIITYRWKFFKNHSLRGKRITLYDLIVNLWKWSISANSTTVLFPKILVPLSNTNYVVLS